VVFIWTWNWLSMGVGCGGTWEEKIGVGRRRGRVVGRRESALQATMDVGEDMSTKVGVVSLIRSAIDVGLRRAERRRAFFYR
jgi:hypothetical protein